MLFYTTVEISSKLKEVKSNEPGVLLRITNITNPNASNPNLTDKKVRSDELRRNVF